MSQQADEQSVYAVPDSIVPAALPTNLPVGALVIWPSELVGAIPPHYLLAHGTREVSRATYSQLFAVYGTTFGAGDGSTTFGLPRYGSVVGLGEGGSPDPFVLVYAGGG